MVSENKRMLRRWWVLVVVCVVVVVGWMIYPKLFGVVVDVTQVVEGPVVEAFYATGTIEPEREYEVRSNVEGILVEMRVDKGSQVTGGQVLAVVRVEEYEMRYRKAMAEWEWRYQLAQEKDSPVLMEFDKKLMAGQEQLAIAGRELERIGRLRAAEAAVEGELDKAKDRQQVMWREVETLKAQRAGKKLELERDLAIAKAELDIARWNLEQQEIKSPLSGVVLDRPVSAGTRVKVNDQLMMVADVSAGAMVMRAQVDEEDKVRTKQGQMVRVTLYAYPGRVFEGRVVKIYPKADADRRTFEVDVKVEPVDEGFSAGMTGELAFLVKEQAKAVVVPAQAVMAGQEEGKWEVSVVKGGKLKRVEVGVGIRSVERAEITKGLAVGEEVVISAGAGMMEEESVVRKRYVEPERAAGLNKKPEEKATKGFN